METLFRENMIFINNTHLHKKKKHDEMPPRVLAQISLAYCYENGIGVSVSKSEAVKYYRLTAQRGNQLGYDELKRMYNEIRPSDKIFDTN